MQITSNVYNHSYNNHNWAHITSDNCSCLVTPCVLSGYMTKMCLGCSLATSSISLSLLYSLVLGPRGRAQTTGEMAKRAGSPAPGNICTIYFLSVKRCGLLLHSLFNCAY